MRWLTIIHKDEDSGFGVTVPDLPGCFSAGSSLDEAIEQAKEAIDLHIEAMLEDGEDIPMPCARPEYPTDPGVVYAFVDIDDDLLSGATQRINITIPSWANSRIDRYAKKIGSSKSGLMWKATLERIQSESMSTSLSHGSKARLVQKRKAVSNADSQPSFHPDS